MENLTDKILALIDDLDYIGVLGQMKSFDEISWRNTGEKTNRDLTDNLPALVDYLKSEYHQGHKIDPQIKCLRESLQAAATSIDNQKNVDFGFRAIFYSCEKWVRWINTYFPQEPGELAQEPAAPRLEEEELPAELNTERAKKYFPRAIAAGYMDNGKWIKSQVRLAYFCSRVYSNPRPINALEDYFGFKKLSASITQAEIAPKRSDVIRWRKEMDDSIFYD